jgi:hypothetical protein
MFELKKAPMILQKRNDQSHRQTFIEKKKRRDLPREGMSNPTGRPS